jgi:hypothetical protein
MQGRLAAGVLHDKIQGDFDQERRNAIDLRRNTKYFVFRRPNTKDFDRACRNAKDFAFDLCACADSWLLLEPASQFALLTPPPRQSPARS